MVKKEIYVDNASTTPCYKEVIKAMNNVLIENFGNPSSEHSIGEKAKEAIINSKRIIAKEINANPHEIIFTSGATESNNLALRGIALAHPLKKKIMISAIEHSSIYEEAMYLKTKGYEVVEIPVDKEGFVDILYIENQIDPETLIVSVMHANNEIGTIQDISAIGEICRARGAIFHTDAVQSYCKEKIDVKSMKIDLLSASAHKIGGPKGAGLLYVNENVDIHPVMIGGGQERGIRAGTENVSGIIGFSEATKIASKIDKKKVKDMRDIFIQELKKIGGKINGSIHKRISNNISVSFKDKNAQSIVISLSEKGIYCSTKSACLAKQKKENRVLSKIGLDKEYSEGTIRFSINDKTKKEDVNIIIKELKRLLK